MKNYFLFLSFCFFSTVDLAQNSKADSLLNVLNTTKEDTIRIKTINQLFLVYEFKDKFKANDYLNQAFELSKKADFPFGLATAYRNQAFFEEDNAHYDKALENAKASLKIFEEMSDKQGISASYNLIGNIHSDQGNYLEALKSHFLSLKIKKELGDKQGEASLYNNIGTSYKKLGNFPEALKNYFACLEIKEELGNKDGIGTSYNNIGNVYYYQNNYAEALKKHVAALKIYEELKDKKGISISTICLGNVYYAQGHFDEALKNYTYALSIKEELGDKKGIADSYNNIGLLYFDLGKKRLNENARIADFDRSLKNYFASLKIREEISDKAGIASSAINLGDVLKKQKKYPEARSYFTKAKKLAEEMGYKQFLREAYLGLSFLDSAGGDYRSAFQDRRMYILYRDSIDNEKTRKKTIQTQMTYDFEKKEAVATAEHKKELENQNLISEEQSHKQKLVLIFVSCFLILVAVFAGFIFRSLRITRKQKDVIESQKDLVEKQKQEVEYQKSVVEDHQKEIIDSIMYARRIQQALLPTEVYIERNIGRLKK